MGASGFSYEEAAKVADCAVGTMKSRVSRARIQLQQILNPEKAPAIDVRADATERRADAEQAWSRVSDSRAEQRRHSPAPEAWARETY